MKGDFSSLLTFGNGNKNVHPTEVAKMLTAVSADLAIPAFHSLPTNTQTKVFPYVDSFLQKKIIKSESKTRAAFILNELSSDDRIAFYSSVKELNVLPI